MSDDCSDREKFSGSSTWWWTIPAWFRVLQRLGFYRNDERGAADGPLDALDASPA